MKLVSLDRNSSGSSILVSQDALVGMVLVCKVEVQGGTGIPDEQTVNKMQLQLY